MNTGYRQYLAVRKDLKEHYPVVDCIGIRRASFNMIWADVEGSGLHDTVTYFFRGERIDDRWVRGRKACWDGCLHAHYPSADPHRTLPYRGDPDEAAHRGV